MRYLQSTVATILIITVACVAGCTKERTLGKSPETVMEQGLTRLKSYIFRQAASIYHSTFSLPEGKVEHLEGWLEEKYFEDKEGFLIDCRYGADLIQFSPDYGMILMDVWSGRLVYQCPADDPNFMFLLYSIGENGVDEKRAGDDIDGSLRYDVVLDSFEDPNFDGNTYRKYRGKLTYDDIDGKNLIRYPQTQPAK